MLPLQPLAPSECRGRFPRGTEFRFPQERRDVEQSPALSWLTGRLRPGEADLLKTSNLKTVRCEPQATHNSSLTSAKEKMIHLEFPKAKARDVLSTEKSNPILSVNVENPCGSTTPRHTVVSMCDYTWPHMVTEECLQTRSRLGAEGLSVFPRPSLLPPPGHVCNLLHL